MTSTPRQTEDGVSDRGQARDWKYNSSQFYSSQPLGTAEVAERRVMAEIGSEKLLAAILRYLERNQPEVRL